MDTRTATNTTSQCDERLLPFLRAGDEAEGGRLLAQLFEEHAAPVVRGVIRGRLRVTLSPGDGRVENQDALELFGDVYTDLASELLALRENAGARPIADFPAYVAGVTHNACHRHLRRKYPRRHSLKTRLRYLLTHHADFALWETGAGSHLCGVAAWRGRPHAPDASDSELASRTRARFGGADAQRMQLAEIASLVFEAARGPLELDELVDAVAELQGVDERPARDEEDETRAREQLADTGVGVDESLEQRVYVARLWEEILELPLNQRAALLLNLRDAQGRDLIALLPYTGVAGVRHIAEALGIPAAEFAALWNDLPLEDAEIAARLGLTRQQVINLRKSARARLGRRMRDF